jgi:hypothetical protein
MRPGGMFEDATDVVVVDAAVVLHAQYVKTGSDTRDCAESA